MNEDSKLSLLVSSGLNAYDINIYDLTSVTKPKCKTINFKKEILVSFDNYEKNVAVYETFSNNLKIYTLNGTQKTSIPSEFNLTCISSYQNRWVLGCDKLGKIYLYDIKKDRYQKCLNPTINLNNGISRLCVSINVRSAYCLHENGIISTFDIKTYNSGIFSCAGESNSSIENCPWRMTNLLTGSRDGTVTLYDANKQMTIGKWKNHDDPVNCLSFSSYNDVLMLSGSNSRVALFAQDGEAPIKIFSTRNRVTSCSMSDAYQFAFGESDGTVSLYDIRKFQEPLGVMRHDDPVRYVQFSCTMPIRSNGSDGEADTRPFHDLDNTSNLSLFRETQLIDYSLNLSANSLLSRSNGDDHGNGQPDQSSCLPLSSPDMSAFVIAGARPAPFRTANCDLSHFVPSSSAKAAAKSAMPAPGAAPKARHPGKQVQFETADPLVHQSPSPFELTQSLPPSSGPAASGPVATGTTGGPWDTAMLRRIINEELRAELAQFESRIQSQIIYAVVDQLAITEDNIVERLLEPTRRVQELAAENERLQHELRKYKYNF